MTPRIGILTFHRAYNFGAVLQVYALQKTIRKLGVQSEIIDYRPAFMAKRYNLTDMPEGFIHGFDHFRNRYYQLSERSCTNSDELSSMCRAYDSIIIGSDQVWNNNITGSDPAFFLDFDLNSTKTISYAASFGRPEIVPEYHSRFQRMIERINDLSVREKTGVDIVRNLTGREATLVLDPTLLLESTQWKSVGDLTSVHEDPYLLVYILLHDELAMQIAKAAQKRLQLPLVVIGHSRLSESMLQNHLNSEDRMVFVGPDKFVELFQNATHVVTNSYHGVLFSILFQKPFEVTLYRDDNDFRSVNSRIRDILDMFEVSHRLILRFNGTFPEELLDHHDLKYQDRLQQEREESLSFLAKAIRKT